MQKAEVNFAILGPEEKCTGDPARRSGNEYLAQMLIQENVATLNNYKPKKKKHLANIPKIIEQKENSQQLEAIKAKQIERFKNTDHSQNIVQTKRNSVDRVLEKNQLKVPKNFAPYHLEEFPNPGLNQDNLQRIIQSAPHGFQRNID